MSLIATASSYLKIHEWHSGNTKHTYVPPGNEKATVKSISWSKDGSWVVLVPSVGPAEVISIKPENIKQLYTIQDVYHPTCASFQCSSKKYVAIGTATGQVLVYDIKSKSVSKRFPMASSHIMSIDCNENDSHLAVACGNGEIVVYGIQTAVISNISKVPKSKTVTTLRFHARKRNYLAGGSEEGRVAVWDINTNKLLFCVQAHMAPITDVVFSPLRDDLLVTSGMDRMFRYYDIVQKTCAISVDVENSISALDFSACGVFMATGLQNGNVVIYDTRILNQPLHTFTACEGKKVTHLAFQKASIVEVNSVCDITEDKPKISTSKHASHGSNSFSYLLNDHSTSEESPRVNNHAAQETEDSFMLAMGLDMSDTTAQYNKRESTLGITEGVRKWMDASKSCMAISNCATAHVSSIHQPKLLETESKSESIHQLGDSQATNYSKKRLASTPKCFSQELTGTGDSPIISFNQTLPFTVDNAAVVTKMSKDLEDLRNHIDSLKLEMREDMKNKLDECKASIRDDVLESNMYMKRFLFAMQWDILKQFVNIESLMERGNNTVIGDEFLLEENQRLRAEIEVLKEKVLEKDLQRY